MSKLNVVITGASRGIGLELVTQALARGDRVLAVAREPGASPELQKLKREHAPRLELCTADVAGGEAALPAITAALSCWLAVDVLINNAGVYKQGTSTEDFVESFKVNSIAPFVVTRGLLDKLRASDDPKAIQITSLMGSIGDNESGGSYAYRASKSALNMINLSLARDESWLSLAVVHPGWVRTRMGGSAAPTSPEESARGIWRVILGLKRDKSGAFYDFEGEELPW